jgi:hypothetical protein
MMLGDSTPRAGQPFTVVVRTGEVVPAGDWRATARLPRPGRWLLTVPNGTHEGLTIPPPIRRAVVVAP